VSPDTTTVLVVALDGERYCVRNDRVANVLGEGELVRSEGERPTAVGELRVGDTTVEVLDVARLFGVREQRGYDGRYVVVFHGITDGVAVGWLVDDVVGVEDVDEAAVTEAPATLEHVEGRFRDDGERTVWLDAAAINARP
jgi:chemotaxis signal transduction protein